MLSLVSRHATRMCDGLRRRELLRIGGLSAVGLGLPSLLAARDSSTLGLPIDPTFGAAKSVIYVWLQGGPPQHETFDPKPDAPSEIRGPFKPIQTNVAGTHFCELLPRTARIADKLAVVRSLATDNNIHSASGYEVLTGYKYVGPNARTITPGDWPWFGSLVKLLKPSERLPPLSTVWIPDMMRLNENVTPAGQTAGMLGSQWDPERFVGDPSAADYEIEGLQLSAAQRARLEQRMTLLAQIDRFQRSERGRQPGIYDGYQQQAYDLLTSGQVRKAFQVQSEPEGVRARYGKNSWGQSLLLARRLIEAGVRLVHVNWTREPGDSAVDNPMWDTHAQNADRLEDVLCPIFDVGFTALIDDLDQRGMLEETLVVAIGEFGRTPKINAKGGRDHWGPVFSFALAGAGVAAGQVYGASDRTGGHPARDRVSAGDLTATLFHLLGIDHRSTFRDTQGRFHRLTAGAPIEALLGAEPARFRPAAPGGSIARVPPYSLDLLLNPDFEGPEPLYPTDTGSRPKGWRAGPQSEGDAFGVRLVEDVRDSATGRRHVFLGFGTAGEKTPLRIEPGAQALLAQEMRNPRAGTFHLKARVRARASSEDFYRQVWRARFTARLVIFRFADEAKDPTRREELATTEFAAPFAAADGGNYETFEIKAVLDSPKPGQNFPIGRGLGIAVVVEQTADGPLDLPGDGSFAALEVEGVSLEFDARTINDKVTV